MYSIIIPYCTVPEKWNRAIFLYEYKFIRELYIERVRSVSNEKWLAASTAPRSCTRKGAVSPAQERNSREKLRPRVVPRNFACSY